LERPAPSSEQPKKNIFKDDSSNGPLGTQVPAFEEAASLFFSPMTNDQ
jgi:hypothetical protein